MLVILHSADTGVQRVRDCWGLGLAGHLVVDQWEVLFPLDLPILNALGSSHIWITTPRLHVMWGCLISWLKMYFWCGCCLYCVIHGSHLVQTQAPHNDARAGPTPAKTWRFWRYQSYLRLFVESAKVLWPLDSQALQAQSALLVRVPSPSPDQCLQLSHYHYIHCITGQYIH